MAGSSDRQGDFEDGFRESYLNTLKEKAKGLSAIERESHLAMAWAILQVQDERITRLEEGQDRISNRQAADVVTAHKEDQRRWAREGGF